MESENDQSTAPVERLVMRRFWLFGGDTHYSSGGMYDFRGSFDSVEEARRNAVTAPMYAKHPQIGTVKWWHVYDSISKSIVAQTVEQAYGAEDLPDFDA